MNAYQKKIKLVIIKAYLDGVQRGLNISKQVLHDDNSGETKLRKEVERIIFNS